MVKYASSQKGSALAVISVIIVVVVIAAIGSIVWRNLNNSDNDRQNPASAQKKPAKQIDKLCKSDKIEANGMFCSEDIGIEFKVPVLFSGKFNIAENYDIFEGPMGLPPGNPAGKSTVLYHAVITTANEDEKLSLSVAKEPLRSGYSKIGHALQSTYFNAETGNLYFVEGVETEYNSATGATKIIRSGYEGKSIPSFEVGKTKIFHGKVGDAGLMEDGYLMVVDDALIIIKIVHEANPMSEPALDAEQSFADLDASLRQIKILK